MRDVLLEEMIRHLPGVSTCTVGPTAVVVVAARGADAADLERRVQSAVDLDGRTLQILGGVRMATGRTAGSRSGAAAELARVALVAGAAAGVVGLVVGPSSARLFDSVLPASRLSSTTALAGGDSARRPVKAVAHRTPAPAPAPAPARPPARLASAVSSPAALAVEPAVVSVRAATTRSRTAAFVVTVAEPAPEATAGAAVVEAARPAEVAASQQPAPTGKRTKATAKSTTKTVMFTVASEDERPTKKAAKADRARSDDDDDKKKSKKNKKQNDGARDKDSADDKDAEKKDRGKDDDNDRGKDDDDRND